METVLINNREIPITFRRSTRAKYLRLSVKNDCPEVVLTVPRFVMNFEINRFLKKQSSWIEKHLGKISEKSAMRPKLKYETGDVFYYFGEPVTLVVRPSEKKRPNVRVRENKMIISLYHKITEKDGKRDVKKAIESFYKKKATEVIHDRLEHFNQHYGLKYKNVVFRDQKTRWGSCSSKKNLNFNWRLIMAPIEVIDYVVVHELCHLKEMNHSVRFWSLVAKQIPDHKTRKKWLKENQILLKI